MLIAHGPLGYLCARGVMSWWNRSPITTLQRRWLYLVAFIGGIFPDIDLLYSYWFNASVTHRQFITHSVLPYISLIIIALLGKRLFKRPAMLWIGLTLFGLGGVSHIIADSIIGAAVWLAPFSNQLIGLQMSDWWNHTWFMRRPLVTILSLELMIIIVAMSTVLAQQWRRRFWISAVILLGVVVSTLWYINDHVYRSNGYWLYKDSDNDAIINLYDLDVDGDQVLNSVDSDIDNDGEPNSLDLYRETFEMTGALYDYTNGLSPEIPLRLGFVSPSILIERLYLNTGLSFQEEMKQAYLVDPTGFQNQPTTPHFGSNPLNWKVWLQRQNRWFKTQPPRLYNFDIIYFASGHVAVYFTDDTTPRVLEAHSSYWQARQLTLSDVITREGKITGVGRPLLPDDHSY